MTSRSFWLSMVMAVLLSLLSSPAFADTITMTCADGTVVNFEVEAGADSFVTQFGLACAGVPGTTDQGGSGGSGSTEPTGVQPEGYWISDGPVCENGGICASNLRCADGSPMQQYVFIDAAGERGETRTVCPGDPETPEVTVTPPTPDEIYAAFREVAPTKSVLSVQPPGGRTLVNFATIFSTEAAGFSTPPITLVKGFSVVFHIFPAAYVWDHGDGSAAVTTTWPGRPWSEGENVEELLTHIYQTTDPVRASVTVRWGATVSLNGGQPQAVAGTVDTPSPEVDLKVLEATPQLAR